MREAPSLRPSPEDAGLIMLIGCVSVLAGYAMPRYTCWTAMSPATLRCRVHAKHPLNGSRDCLLPFQLGGEGPSLSTLVR